MAENPYCKEPLQLLNEFEVEYLIVGGYAVMKYGEQRYTKAYTTQVASNLVMVMGSGRE